ncbi:aromatic ring-hydroxylating dioxygenase subunit alpha [Pandoraea sp.]|uniref:aromatic ring-hydroxylating oxygenase subunit alpha n=1 Tax=Pandoraea sp. TaxID=1883445 RepID=UPI0025CEBB8A|nr:aromatic ring-hydroxylating dioxygenase subunit alpha [Pandoraea sp.]
MFVPSEHWYPVLQSRELGRKPLGVERFGRRLVFWRTEDGRAHAHPDRCPHLGAQLSRGAVDRDCLSCPFHGFAFDAQGQCRRIPAIGRQGKIPKGMALEAFAVREAHGLLWLWWGAPREVYPELPFFPELDDGWRYGTETVEWPVHYTRAIENQLDVAHLPFVHRTTIGAGGRSLVEGPYIESDDHGIRVWVTNAADVGQSPRTLAELATAAAGAPPGLHFRFPALWLLNLGERQKNMIAFVPVNESTTRYYLRFYHRVRNPLLARPLEFIMGLSNRFILNQDRRVVVTQTPRDSAHAEQDRLIGADRAIIEFRRWHRHMRDMPPAPIAMPATER